MSPFRCVVVPALLVSTSCAAPLDRLRSDVRSPSEGNWELSTEDISVSVFDAPFGFAVFDAQGRRVLGTTFDGQASGRAAAAWATGEVDYETRVSPGYMRVKQNLAPFHEGYSVRDSEIRSDGARFVLDADDELPNIVVDLSLLPGTLRYSARLSAGRPRAWSIGFVADADEAYLGFGERFNRMNQRGLNVFSWAEEGGIGLGEQAAPDASNPWPNGELMTYYPVPFFVSSKGYGFWINTTFRSEFDLQRNQPGVWTASHVGPELKFEVYVPSAADHRPWPHHLTDRFTAATGRPMQPPAWAFGPRRRISRNRQARDVPEIQAMRDYDLAITAVDDAVHFFPHGAHLGREAELRSWIRSAHRLGYRVNGYFNSFVARPSHGFLGLAPEGARLGYFLRRADGSYPNLWIVTGGKMMHSYLVDFTRPEGKRWYQDAFQWATSLGYSGWMYDFGEYVPPDVVAADGTTGEELHNAYPVQYARALHEAMESGPLAGDWLAFMRSGYTGSSAYVPMVWAGDPAASFEEADGLPSVLRGGLNLSVSGAPFWGSDIGGYHCVADGARAADEELLVRWIQLAALTPNMQDQDACVGANRRAKATIWNSSEAMRAWRKYARLHTRLQPYLVAWGQRAHSRGEALMRPLFFEHPAQPELIDVDDAYYLGPALLVAPVVRRGERVKRVLLPDDDYLDLERHVVVRGGAHELAAPLEQLPLFLRAGQIVPLLDESIDTLVAEDHPSIVGPLDVADVYDAQLLLTPRRHVAQLTLWPFAVTGRADGAAVSEGAVFTARSDPGLLVRVLEAARTSGRLSPKFRRVEQPSELQTCASCYLIERSDRGLWRLRVTTQADVQLPGLLLRAGVSRRVRWDVFVSAD